MVHLTWVRDIFKQMLQKYMCIYRLVYVRHILNRFSMWYFLLYY